ncbi:MAG: Gfo/Idh/MocA family oxidoreductase [Bacteroidales bacterium]|nr:Gfo/Idh/MocA family oxidoreductase [Bacteroidales bacterium]
MKTINWGIIGCGNVAEVKSGPAFRLAENSELIAVMRRNEALAHDYALRHQVKYWYDDADALINNPEVDAVYVATPPSTHKQFAMMAADAGKPAYVEKPMAMNYKECREMTLYFEDKKIPLFVAYYRRALPRFLKIKSMISEGEIGEVRFVNVLYHQRPGVDDLAGKPNWRVQPEISGGGYFIDLGSHMLDILQFFLGDIISADGRAANQSGLYPAEDIVSGSFIFSSGAQGTGIWNFTAFDYLDRTEIVGDKGKITFATFGNSPIIVETKHGIQSLDLPNPRHIQQHLIQTIVDELNETGICPSTGLTASRTNWAMDKLRS